MRGIAYSLIITGLVIVYLNGIRILELYHGLLEMEVKAYGWMSIGFMIVAEGLIIECARVIQENGYHKRKLLNSFIDDDPDKNNQKQNKSVQL